MWIAEFFKVTDTALWDSHTVSLYMLQNIKLRTGNKRCIYNIESIYVSDIYFFSC